MAILAVGFPVSTLWSQDRQLSAASAELAATEHQSKLLSEQEQQLGSNVEIARIARADYQLVPAGQTLFDILPPAGGSSPTATGGSAAGDPGNQPLVPPADAPSMSPDAGFPGSATAGTGSGSHPVTPATAASPSSFWSRVGDTLEFWK